MTALMIQGTTSDAGKSTLVAGLARLLQRRGVSVAPFKPQNMALNSAVTRDRGEIGRAQALQAQACGLAPHTDMNPVLLKPASDTGAQVIVQGKVLGNMEALDYHAYKKTAREAVLQSFQRLQSQYDCVLVEGAGSPAEINLRENDIANMGFAEAADCPVVLVADIDRGGVFAHLVGTLALLSDSERARISGFIINRFRGDIALLQSGLDWLEAYTGKPVLGVLPYLQDFYLDAEDAIDTQQRREQTALNVVVPVLTRISNHTDFDPLRLHPGVNLQFVSVIDALPPCDLVILPGSKNVRLDLRVLKECGWPAMLDKHLRYGGKLMGICGGLQMLGRVVNDRDGVEDKPGSETALGYLDFVTDLQPGKTLRNLAGSLRLNNKSAGFYGYEIHCGVSKGPDLSRAPVLIDANECPREDGALSADNQILATYVHGLFERPEALALLLEWAGLPAEHNTCFELAGYREHQLERLADTLESSLDRRWLSELEGAV